MPVEESGNMIIMALSYAQKTGDTSQLTKYVRPYFLPSIIRPDNLFFRSSVGSIGPMGAVSDLRLSHSGSSAQHR